MHAECLPLTPEPTDVAGLLASMRTVRHDAEHHHHLHKPNTTILEMPKLQPARMWPRRHAKVAEAVSALEQIDHIELSHIKRIHGVQMYVLNVYLQRHASRIPTTRYSCSNTRAGSLSSTTSSSQDHDERRESISPDYQIEKTQHELHMLRYHTWVYAQQIAKGSCAYCSAFHTLTHHQYSKTKMRLAFLWPRKTTRKSFIEGLLNDLLAMCVHGLTGMTRSQDCEGFENIPVRVHTFTRRHCGIDRL